MFKNLGKIVVCSTLFVLVSVSSVNMAHAQQYNEKTPGYKQAFDAFKAAGVIVIGRDISTEERIYGAGSGVFGYSGVGAAGMSGYFKTNEMVQLFAEYDNAAAPGDKIADGIKFTQAVSFLKAKLKTESATSNKLILMLLEKAFTECFARVSTASEQSKWTARIKNEGLWYAPVKLELMKLAKDDKKERTALIGNAYWYTLGRTATADEQKYWMPRSEYYDQIVAANRSWLLKGPGAADEFPQVVQRALKAYENNAFFAPTEVSIKAGVDTFSAGKGMVYGEMMDYLRKKNTKK